MVFVDVSLAVVVERAVPAPLEFLRSKGNHRAFESGTASGIGAILSSAGDSSRS
jgi:hypothetical protein